MIRFWLFVVFVLELVAFSTSITCPPKPICDAKSNPPELLCKMGDPDKNGCQKFECFPSDPGMYFFLIFKILFLYILYMLFQFSKPLVQFMASVKRIGILKMKV